MRILPRTGIRSRFCDIPLVMSFDAIAKRRATATTNPKARSTGTSRTLIRPSQAPRTTGNTRQTPIRPSLHVQSSKNPPHSSTITPIHPPNLTLSSSPCHLNPSPNTNSTKLIPETTKHVPLVQEMNMSAFTDAFAVQIKQLASEKAELSAQLTRLTDDLNQKNLSHQQEKEKFKENISKNNEELTQIRELNEQFVKDKADYNNTITEMKEMKESLESTIDDMKKTYETTINDMKTQNSEQLDKIQKMHLHSITLQQEVDEKIKNINTLESSHSEEIEQIISNQDEETESFKVQLKTLKDSNEALSLELEKKQSDFSTLIDRMGELQLIKGDLEAQLKTSMIELKKIQTEYTDLRSIYEKSSQELHIVKSLAEKRLLEKSTLETELTSINTQLKKKQDEIITEKKYFESQLEWIKSKHEEEKNELQTNLSDNELGLKIHKLQSENELLTREIEKLKEMSVESIFSKRTPTDPNSPVKLTQRCTVCGK